MKIKVGTTVTIKPLNKIPPYIDREWWWTDTHSSMCGNKGVVQAIGNCGSEVIINGYPFPLKCIEGY